MTPQHPKCGSLDDTAARVAARAPAARPHPPARRSHDAARYTTRSPSVARPMTPSPKAGCRCSRPSPTSSSVGSTARGDPVSVRVAVRSTRSHHGPERQQVKRSRPSSGGERCAKVADSRPHLAAVVALDLREATRPPVDRAPGRPIPCGPGEGPIFLARASPPGRAPLPVSSSGRPSPPPATGGTVKCCLARSRRNRSAWLR